MIHTEASHSEQTLARARELFPGGSLGTYVMPSEAAFAVSHGSGTRIFDPEGNEYLDFVLGSGPMLVGHAHPDVLAATVAQAERGTQFYWFTEQVVQLAETIVDACPCAEQVKFCSTGAESTFYALRLSRAFTGRDKILRFAGAYHGHHDYGMLGRTTGVPAALEPTVVTAPYNDLEATRALAAQHAGELAAIIVEPVQRIVAPRPGFLDGLRTLADDIGAVLIFDEVVTGFRLAWGGAQERYGVTPDLATYGKVIGGGFPLAAVAGRGDILEHADPRRGGPFAYFSGTLNGNPIAAAAGVATLDVLHRAGTYARLDALTERLKAGLREVADRLPRRLHVLGDGPVVGLSFTDGDPADPVAVDRADKSVLKRLERALLEQGIFANVPAKLYVASAHSETDIDRLVDAIGSILPALVAEA